MIERKVNEVFYYTKKKGRTILLKTVEAGGCNDCYFQSKNCIKSRIINQIGECISSDRSLGDPIIFIKM